MIRPVEVTKESSQEAAVAERGAGLPAVAWTSFGFAVLQSVCTALIGLGGGRLIISTLSLAAASSFFSRAIWLHRDGLRIPMMLFAIAGATVNLIVVWQVRRLRNRPSARWRLDGTRLAGKMRSERWQIGLAGLTLALVAVEEWLHLAAHHHL